MLVLDLGINQVIFHIHLTFLSFHFEELLPAPQMLINKCQMMWKMTGLNQTKGERIVCPFAFHTDKLSVPLTLHRSKKLGVRLGFLQALEHDFHLLNRRQRIQDPPHYPDAIQVFLADE